MTARAVLARHRWLVIAGAVLALGVGMLASGKLPVGGSTANATVGAARARVLIDTPYSLVDDLRSDASTIGAQAALLSDRLAADSEVRSLTRQAGLRPGELVVLRPELLAPAKPSTLAEEASTVAGAPGIATLTVTTSSVLPIVTLDAVAPDRRRAARLAATGAAALAALAKQSESDPSHRLRVDEVDPVEATTVAAGGSRLPVAAIGAIIVFAFWCMAIVVGTGLARAWRRGLVDPARVDA